MIYTNSMSRRAKKRTKRYHGEDAKRTVPAASEPVIHRYEAVERSRFGEWLEPRKKLLRFGLIATAIATGSIWLLIELIQMIF